MTTIQPASQRLLIRNLHFERDRDKSVRILTLEGEQLAVIDVDDWAKVANFFDEICGYGFLEERSL